MIKYVLVAGSGQPGAIGEIEVSERDAACKHDRLDSLVSDVLTSTDHQPSQVGSHVARDGEQRCVGQFVKVAEVEDLSYPSVVLLSELLYSPIAHLYALIDVDGV